jgi:hypothetical protein
MESVRDRWPENQSVDIFSSLESVEQVNISFRLTEQFRLDSYGNFADDEKAGLFYDALKGFVAAAKLSVSDDRSAVDILNKIKIEQDGRSVRMHFEMSQEEIRKMVDKEYKIASLDFQH